ncbi:hypothetical protein BDR04DRAFT_1150099 [Suillus decipiens]|nr:hypothetical protein BDR04DRAFT_1150099 [Suillus decipiens]
MYPAHVKTATTFSPLCRSGTYAYHSLYLPASSLSLRWRGPQPATHGHVQTLGNLVDEWSPVMRWDIRRTESRTVMPVGYLRAHDATILILLLKGTSDHPLPDVNMDRVYAGSGAGSLVPFS